MQTDTGLQGLFAQKNRHVIMTGLAGLDALTAKWEQALDEDYLEFQTIVEESFGTMTILANNILYNYHEFISNKDNTDVLSMLYSICKIFFQCNRNHMCFFIGESDWNAWVKHFKIIIDMDVLPDLSK